MNSKLPSIQHLIGTGPADALGVHRARRFGGRGLGPAVFKVCNESIYLLADVHSRRRLRQWKEVWQKFRDLVGSQ